jgi:hypothetical protein
MDLSTRVDHLLRGLNSFERFFLWQYRFAMAKDCNLRIVEDHIELAATLAPKLKADMIRPFIDAHVDNLISTLRTRIIHSFNSPA